MSRSPLCITNCVVVTFHAQISFIIYQMTLAGNHWAQFINTPRLFTALVRNNGRQGPYYFYLFIYLFVSIFIQVQICFNKCAISNTVTSTVINVFNVD